MTTKILDLPVLLPRGSDCAACVEELAAALGNVGGISRVEGDVQRGLLHVAFDPETVTFAEVARVARRVGAQAHCAMHCPDDVHEHGDLDLGVAAPDASRYEQRLIHVTGLDCADCALKLQSHLEQAEGVLSANTSFGASVVRLTYDPGRVAFTEALQRVHELGYGTLEAQALRPQTVAYAVEGMDCADCAAKLESRLRRIAGVSDVRVDFALARLVATYDPRETAEGALRATAAEMGYHLVAPVQQSKGFWLRDRRAIGTAASGALVIAGFVAQLLGSGASPYLFTAAAVVGGTYVGRAAFYSLRTRQIDMNVLMTLAVLGAVAIGEWAEAGLVTFLFALGNALQAFAMERTRRAISSLIRLAPDEATVLRGDREVVVPASEVAVGDVVLTRPGERLAVDGVVIEGAAAANQAPITGESLPVAKQPGDHVFAGSILDSGALRVRATSTAADNTIAKIIHLVEEAQAQRAPVEGIVDRFAAKYTPAVVALATTVALLPPLLGAPFDTWFYRGLALLIIACPCALVISTPVSIVSALGAATRRGVLVKGGVYLEEGQRIRVAAIDKTGTLTAGEPTVTDVVPLNGHEADRVLAIAAACERPSEHTLARALVAAGDGEHLRTRRFHTVTGKGVRAEIGGETYLVGKVELFAPAVSGKAAPAIERLARQGKTAVVVGTPSEVLGVIAVADTLRPGASGALAALRRSGVERLVMLTGDNEETAAAVASQAGVDEVRASLLPDDKIAAVRDLREQYGPVLMIGDGVNDAPALAAADLGVAMGAAGTDAALETADVALMGDDLSAVADFVLLSRRTDTVVRENIALSIAVKGLFLALAPLGLVSLWLAVFADMGTSLAVIANGLRLQRVHRA